ncbi:pyridoxamine 5'-phosphate oxidase family protein [Clostridium beijerinckii]|uniref:Pyridoxamine 5'-phosphate oxidase family protein n=1 Tax=Clostridium beijerinckii TaxID=1520 RepID=A0AAX0B907_CLOBE|nr:pyridoxamine 5'-phosphate oxidase family protein [Clostridium beijerinckii]MBA8933220.1 putative pyridoxamine 5'-phosphate oxidase family protein [Clostridium beijerinckii]NRT36834.1 putative pyridoxamine 5'-phosphate oxidase family protein [Clostridium beijerinckii]NRT43733.1 putative pyridoxamine 5'-phosphate oxidase family protein [Clostridium beijerinckii]NRT91636.1 putative pyridoxamine 5'-phosphate oxidase family protein [Clostridium beijerinckii]NRU37421.1 putative pyridoxamine 5'-ph
MNEVLEFLLNNPTFYIATMDGDQPRVRPFGAVMKYKDKLYFTTNNTKSVFEQLVANPKVEISTTSPKGEWIRLTGKAVFDSNAEAKSAMLESVPSLKKMYSLDDNIFEVFYLEDAVVTFSSFSSGPKTIRL